MVGGGLKASSGSYSLVKLAEVSILRESSSPMVVFSFCFKPLVIC